jgi:hypothetical protein
MTDESDGQGGKDRRLCELNGPKFGHYENYPETRKDDILQSHSSEDHDLNPEVYPEKHLMRARCLMIDSYDI